MGLGCTGMSPSCDPNPGNRQSADKIAVIRGAVAAVAELVHDANAGHFGLSTN
jgi:hypothetical protein